MRATTAACVRDAAGVLPRRGDAHAVERLGHQDRSLAARARWNGKFQAVGNGGWAGIISYAAMAAAVAAGYATASTDTGHVGGTGAFALGHPEKVIDFGYRAVHEMTVKAKAVIDAFYGSAAHARRSGMAARREAGRASPRPFAIRPTSTRSSPARRR